MHPAWYRHGRRESGDQRNAEGALGSFPARPPFRQLHGLRRETVLAAVRYGITWSAVVQVGLAPMAPTV